MSCRSRAASLTAPDVRAGARTCRDERAILRPCAITHARPDQSQAKQWRARHSVKRDGPFTPGEEQNPVRPEVPACPDEPNRMTEPERARALIDAPDRRPSLLRCGQHPQTILGPRDAHDPRCKRVVTQNCPLGSSRRTPNPCRAVLGPSHDPGAVSRSHSADGRIPSQSTQILRSLPRASWSPRTNSMSSRAYEMKTSAMETHRRDEGSGRSRR